MIAHPTAFVKKSIYDTYGLYSREFDLVSDYEFMLRLKSGKVNFYFVEDVLANFRMNGATHIFAKKLINENLLLQKKYGIISLKKYYLKRLIAMIRSLIN
jgi:hypothetical protein